MNEYVQLRGIAKRENTDFNEIKSYIIKMLPSLIWCYGNRDVASKQIKKNLLSSFGKHFLFAALQDQLRKKRGKG